MTVIENRKARLLTSLGRLEAKGRVPPRWKRPLNPGAWRRFGSRPRGRVVLRQHRGEPLGRRSGHGDRWWRDLARSAERPGGPGARLGIVLVQRLLVNRSAQRERRRSQYTEPALNDRRQATRAAEERSHVVLRHQALETCELLDRVGELTGLGRERRVRARERAKLDGEDPDPLVPARGARSPLILGHVTVRTTRPLGAHFGTLHQQRCQPRRASTMTRSTVGSRSVSGPILARVSGRDGSRLDSGPLRAGAEREPRTSRRGADSASAPATSRK
jgi:hypothetical protein